MYSTIEVSVGKGHLCIKATIIKTHDGIAIYVGGGEKTHIGTVVISQPRASLDNENVSRSTNSIINTIGHKDDEIAIPIAEEVCQKFKVMTVVTAGIHIENADVIDIENIKSNCEKLKFLIIDKLAETYY
ncbi:hypothetical protein GC105_11735 [Alkalibaculum sp. M08DMB]|uniref:Prenylated flavin chaperone LpdD-like domain-containing protein n=1 Tax=Alkalibaculum sporogenes TaxID=2655001 RepID=A0A6A7KB05_9FIRM|nr:hypothetical protein [Alkalibaculum sporogenes]MPW26461.1 hypothetical protein [Alkalibaculum sporogenes]